MTFARKTPPRKRAYPSAISLSQRRNAVFARMDVPAAPPQAKDAPVRSEAYRRLVAAMPCKACGVQGYSQAAHPNSGKGLGIKTSDLDCFALCCDRPGVLGCHCLFDNYQMGGKRAQALMEQAWAADTRAQINALGLWPATLSQLHERDAC